MEGNKLDIQIHKDIDEYKNELWKGMTLRQCFFGGIGVGIYAIIFLLAYFVFYVPLDVAVYLGLPFSLAVFIFGFVKKDDLTFYEYYKEMWRLEYQAAYVYQSEEYTQELENVEKVNSFIERKEKRYRRQSNQRKEANRKTSKRNRRNNDV